ncbi:GRAM domain-containing protein 2A-like isoform X2 [Kryptolebias marmoratus]|uniref:GRAM domain-containing protein 2A-like isoform X2 n=1 Tax=Kryptolebias marmoratus TaxID=37003 RepID=UPI0007F89C57|nr:GRAM domain-containing protein 2A-like isoform X2 [Kryptolebias marmoratus]
MSLKNRKSTQDNFSLDVPRPVGVRRSNSVMSIRKPSDQSHRPETSELEAVQLNYNLDAKIIPSKKPTDRSQSLETAELEASQLNYNLSSKVVLREQNITEEFLGRSDGFINSYAYLKYNKTFHKLFPDIPEGESLTHVFTCSLQREVLYHGKLFVSDYHICFYSSVLLKETKVVIPVSSVREIKKHNSALSMLSVQTSGGEKYIFVSLRNLKFRYKLLQNICRQFQEESGNSSPQLSSAEVDAAPDTVSLRLFRKYEGQKRTQGGILFCICLCLLQMSISYSSEDSTEKDFSSMELDSSFLPMIGEAPSNCSSARENSSPNEDRRAVSLAWRFTEKVAPFFFRDVKNFSVLFYVYILLLLLLLLASGYIGLRITALEEQLSSLGSLADLSREYQET